MQQQQQWAMSKYYATLYYFYNNIVLEKKKNYTRVRECAGSCDDVRGFWRYARTATAIIK